MVVFAKLQRILVNARGQVCDIMLDLSDNDAAIPAMLLGNPDLISNNTYKQFFSPYHKLC